MGSGRVLVGSGGFWCDLLQFWLVMVGFLWVLVSSGGFCWGSCGFWWVLVQFWWVLVGFL